MYITANENGSPGCDYAKGKAAIYGLPTNVLANQQFLYLE